MAIDKEKLKDGLKNAVNTGVNVVKEVTPYVSEGLKLAGQVANSIFGNSSSSAGKNSTYTPSNQTQQYQTQMNNLQKPVQQDSQWQQQLNDTMNAILNREKFSYDLNGDALYQQYKDQYTLGGQMAMQDTMGQASAMTGGYGNSYAQTVGQQQYQGYLQQLNDKIPELYQLALNTYNQESSDLYNRYGMLADAEAQEYARYRDQMSDYYTDRDYLTNQYYNERDFDYNKYIDDRNYQYQLDRDKVSDEQWQKQYDRDVLESDRQYYYQLNRDAISDKRYDTEWQYQLDRDAVEDSRYDQQWQYQLDRDAISDERYNNEWQYQLDRDAISDKRYDSEWQYQLGRDKVSDSQWQKAFNEGIRQYNASLAEDKRQANLNYELSKKKISSTSSGSGGGVVVEESKPSWNNGNLTSEQVKELQRYYGVNADGKWGSKSSSKAGGLSADKAWTEYQNNKNANKTQSKKTSKNTAVKSFANSSSVRGELATLATKGYTLKELNEYVDTYEAMGVINAIDAAALRRYCKDLSED